MTGFIIIFFGLVLGWLCRSSPRFPVGSARALNSFVIVIALPAVILVQFPLLLRDVSLEWGMLALAIAPWIVFLGSWGIFSQVGKRLGWTRATIGAVVLTAGLGNTSFVGFPLLEALMGADSIRYGIVADQFGSFLTLSLLGIPVAAYYSGGSISATAIGMRIVTFPPFLALIASVVWFFLGLPLTETLTPVFQKVGGTLVPIALFAVGLQIQLNLKVLSQRAGTLAMGLGYKLLLMPVVFLLFLSSIGVSEIVLRVTVLQSAMAPMITAAIIAAEFDLDTEIASLMVAIGIPLSLLSVPLLHVVI